MPVRILAFNFNNKDKIYKLVGYDKINNIGELIKSLHYMQKNEIPLTINNEDIVDTGGKEYFIKDISIVFPTIGGEVNTYLAIYVDNA